MVTVRTDAINIHVCQYLSLNGYDDSMMWTSRQDWRNFGQIMLQNVPNLLLCSLICCVCRQSRRPLDLFLSLCPTSFKGSNRKWCEQGDLSCSLISNMSRYFDSSLKFRPTGTELDSRPARQRRRKQSQVQRFNL